MWLLIYPTWIQWWQHVRGIHRSPVNSSYKGPGPCITNIIATCRKNFSQWESSFLWKLRCHWLKFLRRVAKTLVIQGPVTRKMSPFDDVIMRRTPFGVHRFLKTVSGLTRTCHRGWSVCKFDTLLQIGFSNHVYVVQNYCGLRTWNIPLSLHLGFPAGNIYAAKMEMITKIFRLQQKW